MAALLALPIAGCAGSAAVPRLQNVSAASGRTVPITSWAARGRPKGTIVFSHGAQSSPDKYPAFIAAWAAAGYDIHAPLHVDSLEHPLRDRFPGLAGWAARIEDMRAVSRLVNGPYLAAGHSYGALTALVMGGAQAALPPGVSAPLKDPQAVCCLAISPPGPIPGLIDAAGYEELSVPALITTGTLDLPPASVSDPQSWRSHLAAFEAARPGQNRYAAVISGADHYFGGAVCDYSKPGPPQLHQLATAVQLSSAFFDRFRDPGDATDWAPPPRPGVAFYSK